MDIVKISNQFTLQWLNYLPTADGTNVAVNLPKTNTKTYSVITTVHGNTRVNNDSATITAATWRDGNIYSFTTSVVTIRKLVKTMIVYLNVFGNSII